MSHRFSTGLKLGLRASQGMVVIAFCCRKSINDCILMSLALSSINTDFVAKAWDDNGFQDAHLISWSIKIALNSDQIQLSIM